jgi:hypothetical protein
MQGVWVFASAAARDAAVTSPEEGNFAYLKDTNVTTYYTGSAWANLDTTGMTNPMTTTGDTIYSSSGSTPARLGIGTAGQVLRVNSGATAPEWATPAGGKVLQVVSATTTTSTAIATTTLTDTTVTATITPSLASSKILVIVSGSVFASRPSSTDVWAEARLLRASTTLMDWANFDFIGINMPSSGNTQVQHQISMNYLDSPSSTSALIYKVQSAHGNAGTITWQINSTPSTITLMEIGA